MSRWRDDYSGTDISRKELHKRLAAAYQLAGRLLMTPEDPPEARLEMEIVLLDFLSDPGSADVDRLTYAARAFQPMPRFKVTATISVGGDSKPVPVSLTGNSA